MKRLLLVIAALATGGMLFAQSDSVAVEAQHSADGKLSVATPSVDTASHAVIGDSVPMEEVRKLSRRQQMKYFGHDFSSWFVEVKYLYGTRDMAIGLNLSYVPNVVGFYGTFMNGVNAYWGSAGVVYRFSRIESRVDWQAYAGFVAGFGYGGEVGLRLARVNRRHKTFSWLSVSVGAAITNYGSFFSCGLSLPFGVPAAAVSLF